MTDLIPLDQIDPNPYQPRTSMDLEALERLARGIKLKREQLPDTLGLMQVPMARRVEGGRCQLAFGHRRFEAFKHLYRIDGKASDWWFMPLQLVVLSDEEMYDFAARENGDREDINPIEKARSILEAQEKFGWQLQRAASAHGLSKSAASNLTRLLQLPEPVQKLVISGELGQRHARELVRLVQLDPAPLEKVSELAHQAAYDEMPVSQLERGINDLIRQHNERLKIVAYIQDKTCPNCDSLLRMGEGNSFGCGVHAWRGVFEFDIAWSQRRARENQERQRQKLQAEQVTRYCSKCNTPAEFNALAVDGGKYAQCSQCGHGVILYAWLKTPRIYRPLYLNEQKPSDDRKPACPFWTWIPDTAETCYICGKPAEYHNNGHLQYPGADLHLCKGCYTKNLEKVVGIDFDDALKNALDQIKLAQTFYRCRNSSCRGSFTVPSDTLICKKCGVLHQIGMTGLELAPGEAARLDKERGFGIVEQEQPAQAAEPEPQAEPVFLENDQPTNMEESIKEMTIGNWEYRPRWDGLFQCLVCGKNYQQENNPNVGRWFDLDSYQYGQYHRNLCTRCYPMAVVEEVGSENDDGDWIINCYKCGAKCDTSGYEDDPIFCTECGARWPNVITFDAKRAEYQALAAKAQLALPLLDVFPENGLEDETARFRSKLHTRIGALINSADLSMLVELDCWLDDAEREIFQVKAEVLP